MTQSATDKLIADNLWRDISEAPRDGQTVQVRLVSGMIVYASYEADYCLDSDGALCGQWVCSDELYYPNTWTDGACWQVNENGEISDQPTHFRTLPDDRCA